MISFTRVESAISDSGSPGLGQQDKIKIRLTRGFHLKPKQASVVLPLNSGECMGLAHSLALVHVWMRA